MVRVVPTCKPALRLVPFAPQAGWWRADDDMVLETAINGRADGIGTFNRRDFDPAERRFGIAVLSPGDAVRRIRATLAVETRFRQRQMYRSRELG